MYSSNFHTPLKNVLTLFFLRGGGGGYQPQRFVTDFPKHKTK